ncbi:alpha/beta hydrolase [Pseudidiomarina taiwanensis]|uniref:Alpha/beta hydrolase n=1 Tax=Pseudidiomarina taiwanensis TaxID=337250 RepID=A0A432ZMV3_9GAMM|nr:alpha/beta hydrolase [Pseudidiomarina taiwanensis]RUO79214.1 alpha/beta hydrolase [Pseudidiomarina taiwanensis]
MKIKIYSLMFVLASAISASAHAEIAERVSYGAVLEQDITGSAEVLRYGELAPQFIEYWPATQPPKNLNIAFIHGGCWLDAYDIAHTRAATSALAAQGYPTWSIEYRRSSAEQKAWPEADRDIRQALQQIRAKIGTQPLVVMGHSAGGHLALLAAAEPTPSADAVIGLAAITDVVAYGAGENSCQASTAQFFGGDALSLAEAYQAANPVSKDFTVPVYLLGSENDRIIPAEQMKLPTAELKWVANADHFDFVHTATPAWQQLLQTLQQLEQQLGHR